MRDYVKKKTKIKQPSNMSNKWLYLGLFFFFFCCASLVFFFLQENDEKKEILYTSEQVKENILPSKPIEAWTYVEALPKAKVIVDDVKVQDDSGPFLMQCGAFKSQVQAQKLADRIEVSYSSLYPIVKKSVTKSGATWYRVILGPYNKRRIAETDRYWLQKKGLYDCKIWLWSD